MKNIKKVSELNEIEIITELEGGAIKVTTLKDLSIIRNICKKFMYSQGFYGRLLKEL